MTLSEWLDAQNGRLTETAKHFAITPAAVHQWKTNGVPVDRMRSVELWTRGAVTLQDMVTRTNTESA